MDVAGSLVQLPAALLSAELLLADPCVARFLKGARSFVVEGRGGLPMEPGAWLPSFQLVEAVKQEMQTEAGEQ